MTRRRYKPGEERPKPGRPRAEDPRVPRSLSLLRSTVERFREVYGDGYPREMARILDHCDISGENPKEK